MRIDSNGINDNRMDQSKSLKQRKWTQQEEEILIRLYEDPKVFPKDIAKMLGRALQQVYYKARAMGLKAPME